MGVEKGINLVMHSTDHQSPTWKLNVLFNSESLTCTPRNCIYIYIYIHIYINFPVTSPEDSVETCVLDFYPCFDIRHNWDDRVSSTRRSHFTLGTHNWTRPYLEWNPEPEPPALWSSASTNCATACPIVTPRTSCYYWNWNLHWEIQMLCISRYRVNSSYISKPEGMTHKRMGQLIWPVTVNM